MRGATLLETMVVIVLISSLSLMGINTINNFRRDATIENITDEFISDIRRARSRSINGEFLEKENIADFENSKLPEYGVKITDDGYELVRRCTYFDGKSCVDDEPTEIFLLDTDYELSPSVSFYFERISGNTEENTLTIKEKFGNLNRVISISTDSIITVTEN